MRFPGCKTHPAEVVLASFAHHMVAASVFLNRCIALWTLLQSTTPNTKIFTVFMIFHFNCLIHFLILFVHHPNVECLGLQSTTSNTKIFTVFMIFHFNCLIHFLILFVHHPNVECLGPLIAEGAIQIYLD